MGSLKLPHSGGNSVSIAAPQSNPSSDRTLYVPGNANGTILTNTTSGCVLQVVQHTTSSEVSSTSDDFVDTGLSGSITPSSSSSKILIMVSQIFRVQRSNVDAFGGFQILRGSTVIQTGPNGNTGANPFGGMYIKLTGSGASETTVITRYNIQYLDSPSTTSATTYKTQMAVHAEGDSSQVRSQYQAGGENGASYLTLMEVAG
jgi:hypothetical protein